MISLDAELAKSRCAYFADTLTNDTQSVFGLTNFHADLLEIIGWTQNKTAQEPRPCADLKESGNKFPKIIEMLQRHATVQARHRTEPWSSLPQ